RQRHRRRSRSRRGDGAHRQAPRVRDRPRRLSGGNPCHWRRLACPPRQVLPGNELGQSCRPPRAGRPRRDRRRRAPPMSPSASLYPKTFEYELTKSGVATITLSRPDTLNSLTFEVYQELRDTFAALDRDDAVRAVLITGRGRAFCSGGDVNAIIG